MQKKNQFYLNIWKMCVNYCITYGFNCDFNVKSSIKISAFAWVYLFILFYGYPFSLYGVNCITVEDIYHFNTTEDIFQTENQYGNFSGHQIKWKKVRKKNLDNCFSHHHSVIPEKRYETNNANNLTLSNLGLDAEEPLYLGYARNPFGSSVLWNKNHRSIDDNNIDYAEKNGKASGDGEIREVRGKRGVTHLYNMLSCATGCNPLAYKGYGCYCGFLGSGKIIDSIDRCCMMHDVCYTSVNCPVFFVYFMPYLWRCWRGRPLCAVDHLGYGHADSCAARLCECDKQLALCLARRPCPNKRALCMSSPWRLFQNLVML